MRRLSDNRMFWSFILVAGVSVAVAAGPLPWRLSGESGVLDGAAPTATPETSQSVSLRSVLDLSPFGAVAKAPTVGEAAPVADLGLTLHGVIIANPASRSSAIISGESQPVKSYLVGEVVAGSASLGAVFADHVVLRVGDHDETLWFPRAPTGEGSARAASSGSGVAALRALVEAGTDTGEAQPEAPQAPSETDTEAVINRYRERLRDDPATVLSGLGLESTEAGYAVSQSASEGVLSAGLRPGDIVSRVNGQQVGNIENQQDFFDEVISSGRARVEIVRNGQPIVLSFPLR